MTRNQALAAPLALMALALSGCGGDGGRDEPAAGRQPKQATSKADQARARAIVLKLSDFPTGWRVEQRNDDSSAECATPDLSDLTRSGRAESLNFVQGAVTSASSYAAVFASTGDSRAAYRRGRASLRRSVVDCLERLVRESGDKDVKVTRVSGGEMSFPPFGDQSSAFQVAVGFETDGLTPTAYFDMVVIQRERAVAFLVFVDVLTPFDEAQERRLVASVARRMESTYSPG